MKEYKIVMPPTKKNLALLFKALNLDVAHVKQYDCLIYCRGKKMEQAPPEDFQFSKLLEWFLMNIRTLNHINRDNVDPDWRDEKERAVKF